MSLNRSRKKNSSSIIKPPTVRTSINLGTIGISDIGNTQNWNVEPKHNESLLARDFLEHPSNKSATYSSNEIHLTPQSLLDLDNRAQSRHSNYESTISNHNASIQQIISDRPFYESFNNSSLLHDKVLNCILEEIKSLDTSHKISQNNGNSFKNTSDILNLSQSFEESRHKPNSNTTQTWSSDPNNESKVERFSPKNYNMSLSFSRIESTNAESSERLRKRKRLDFSGRPSFTSTELSFRPELAVSTSTPGPMDYSPRYDAILDSRTGGALKHFGTQKRFEGAGSYLNLTANADLSGGIPSTPSNRDKRGGARVVQDAWLSNFDYTVNNSVHHHARYSEHWKNKLELYKEKLKDKPVFSWLMNNHFSRYGWGMKKLPGARQSRKIRPDVIEAAASKKYLFSDQSLQRKNQFIHRKNRQEEISINPYSAKSAYFASSKLDKYGRVKKKNKPPIQKKKMKVKIAQVPDRYIRYRD